MAIKTLNTRIITKHAEWSAWDSSTLPLKEGEVVLAKVTTTESDSTGRIKEVPAYIAKVGVDGKTFKETSWMYAKAVDVYAWAKKANLDLADIPTITLDSTAASAIKTALTGKVDTTTYSAKIADIESSISALGGDTGTIASALAEAKAYADTLNTAMDGRVDTIEADYLKAADKTQLDGKINGVDSRVTALESQVGSITDGTNGIEAKAKAYTDEEVEKANQAAGAAQTAADNAQGEVDALEAVVSTLTQTVATNKSNIESALADETAARTKGDSDTLDAAKADAASKDTALHTTISNEIDADVEAARSALQANIDKKVDKTAYDTKVSALEAADGALGGRLDTVETKLANVSNVMDFVGAADALPAEGSNQSGDVIVITEGANSGKEFVYDDSRETGKKWVEFGSTSAADSAIAQLQTDVQNLGNNKLDKTVYNEKVAELEAADGTLQGNIDTLSGTVTTNKNTYDAYVTSNNARVQAVEVDIRDNVKPGISGNTASINAVDARVSAIEGDYLKADDKTELEGAIEDEASARDDADKALGQRIDGVSGNISTVSGRVTTLEGKVAANEGAISDNTAAITAMDTAYKAADTQLTNDLSALTARVGTAETNIGTISTTLSNKADTSTVNGINTRLAAVETNAIFDEDEVILDCGGAQ